MIFIVLLLRRSKSHCEMDTHLKPVRRVWPSPGQMAEKEPFLINRNANMHTCEEFPEELPSHPPEEMTEFQKDPQHCQAREGLQGQVKSRSSQRTYGCPSTEAATNTGPSGWVSFRNHKHKLQLHCAKESKSI